MATIEIKNLTKAYSANENIFENFSVSFDDNEFIVILGPSGCGKSTLLRSIAGLETIQAGQILIDGLDVVNTDPKNRDMAMVFQNYALYPSKTIYGNLEFGLRMRNVPKQERKRRIHEVADTLGILEYLDRKPKQLSGGQKQRVALGRALVNEPKLFLMDEPLSNLDAKLRVKMRSEIIQIHKQVKRSIIYVTHDQVEAMTMADRVLLLNHGEIQQFDRPDLLYHQPRNVFTALFIGSPQMNLYRLPVTQGQVELAGLQLSVPETYYKDEIYLGFRAEDGQLHPEGPIVYNHSENLGNEYLVYANFQANEVITRSEVDLEKDDIQNYHLELNQEKLHWFDVDTEIRISGGD